MKPQLAGGVPESIPLSWSDRRLAFRDRLLSSPRFQRWAAAFPPTRRIARHAASELFDVCAGFVYSQILFACVQLKLFDLLRSAPRSAADIATQLQLPLTSAEHLLRSAASLRLVESRGGERFGLGALGAALLGNPAVEAMVEHHRLLYADLRDPVALLRSPAGQTELARYWAYAARDLPASPPAGPEVAAYTTLMSRSQSLVAAEILDAYSIAKHKRLLDVGGGDGTFLAAAAARSSQLQLMLFDLPPVAERASQRFLAEGLAARAQVFGGDFRCDGLPVGADLLSLVRVVHDHDDPAVLALMQAAYRALAPGGVLLLAEPMQGTPGAERVGGAYFEIYLLAMGQGRPRAPQELRQMLQRAGFERSEVRATRQPLQCGLIVAHKSP